MTSSGETTSAPVVAASCDPRQLFLRLVERGKLTSVQEQRIRQFRMRGTTAQALLALNAPIEFDGRPGRRVEFAHTAEDLDAIERAFDAVKYGHIAETPVLDVHVPTVSNPDLAPEGGEVVSVLVHFAPYDLSGGWNVRRREDLLDRVVEILGRHASKLAASLVGRTLIDPTEIESRYGCSGGQIHHGEQALDQLLVRPAPACARYATPISGLYLCGSGSHPGGGLTCGPGGGRRFSRCPRHRAGFSPRR